MQSIRQNVSAEMFCIDSHNVRLLNLKLLLGWAFDGALSFNPEKIAAGHGAD